MHKIGIVIIHYGNFQSTIKAVKSCLIQNNKNKFTVVPIIINNQKNYDLNTEIKKLPVKCRLFDYKDNYGFSKGNNIGIKIALEDNCQTIVLLNNDAYFTDGNLDKLISFALLHPNYLISPKIYFAPGYEYHFDRYNTSEIGKIIWYAGGILNWKYVYASHRGVDEVDKGQFSRTINTDFATGCCMVFSKQIVDEIGLFDEKYFLYFEDVDYSIRVKRRGFKVKFFPGSYLYHENAQSTGLPGSSLHKYYQTRNRLYFGFKYASLQVKKSLFIESLHDIIFSSKRKAVFDYYFNKMGKFT